jgi:hypothetical protein
VPPGCALSCGCTGKARLDCRSPGEFTSINVDVTALIPAALGSAPAHTGKRRANEIDGGTTTTIPDLS